MNITFTNGQPDTTALPHDTILGPDGQPYMTRHHLTDTTRLHHLLTSDPQPDPHDHPWDFITLLLTGAYREHNRLGPTIHRAPTIVTHQADDLHRLELLDGPMWTYVVTGPVRRRWGFHTAHGWVHWTRYPHTGSYLDGIDATPRPPFTRPVDGPRQSTRTPSRTRSSRTR